MFRQRANINLAIIDDYFNYSKGNCYNCSINSQIPPSHGDRVYYTILKYLKDTDFVNFYLLSIYDGYGNSTIELFKHLEKLYSLDNIDIIVLCLSFKKKATWNSFFNIAGSFHSSTFFLIAESPENISSDIIIPDNILFIEKGFFCNPNCCSSSIYSNSVVCDSLPEFIKITDDYFIFHGSSKGTAIMAAKLVNSQLLYQKTPLNSLKNIDYNQSDIKKILDHQYHHHLYYDYSKIKTLLKDYYTGAISDLLNYNLYKLIRNESVFYRILMSIIRTYTSNVTIEQLFPYDYYCLNNLIFF